MKTVMQWFLVLMVFILLNACAVIRPGEVGIKQRFGKIIGGNRPPGLYPLNPFFSTMLKIPVRTINMAVNLETLPSKEGLSIECELAILYHIKPEYAVKIVETVGLRYEDGIILSTLRSATADITSQFFAKDMHTSERENIEKAISQKISDILGDRGFVIEAVLLKSIRLPEKLSMAIEEKLTAEQQSQTMKFILERQHQEAERQRIEAEGIRNAQKIINEGLTDMIIKYHSLEVFKALSQSPNSKVIITDGKTPVLIQDK